MILFWYGYYFLSLFQHTNKSRKKKKHSSQSAYCFLGQSFLDKLLGAAEYPTEGILKKVVE